MSDKDETAENFSDNEKGNLTKILFFYFKNNFLGGNFKCKFEYFLR